MHSRSSLVRGRVPTTVVYQAPLLLKIANVGRDEYEQQLVLNHLIVVPRSTDLPVLLRVLTSI